MNVHDATPALIVAVHNAALLFDWSVKATDPTGEPGVVSLSATVADTMTVPGAFAVSPAYVTVAVSLATVIVNDTVISSAFPAPSETVTVTG